MIKQILTLIEKHWKREFNEYLKNLLKYEFFRDLKILRMRMKIRPHNKVKEILVHPHLYVEMLKDLNFREKYLIYKKINNAHVQFIRIDDNLIPLQVVSFISRDGYAFSFE